MLRRAGEPDLTPEIAAKLGAMSAPTIDVGKAGERRQLQRKGRSGSRPSRQSGGDLHAVGERQGGQALRLAGFGCP